MTAFLSGRAIGVAASLVVIVAVFIVAVLFLSGGREGDSAEKSSISSIETHRPSPHKAILETPKTRSSSEYPIGYNVGTVDPRFGLSREILLKLVDEAAQVWETPISTPLFRYDTAAELTINLIFDERQAKANEASRAKSLLAIKGKTFEELKATYDSKIRLKEKLEGEYKDSQAELDHRLDDYNSRVAMWNGKGGAPPSEFRALEGERDRLEALKRQVERQVGVLNETIQTVNDLAGSLNELSGRYTLAVENYNDRFVAVREFEKGLWNGKSVDVFEFQSEADLRLTLVHELGHVLGFGHVNDPNAIMYYKLEKQDVKHPRLTNDDLELLHSKISTSS